MFITKVTGRNLLAAAKKQRKQPPSLLEQFAAATPHERAMCMSVHVGEMYAVLDMVTSPVVGPVPPAADDLFVAQHH